MKYQDNLSFAQKLDKEDALAVFRSEFHFPAQEGREHNLYFLGNSLGLQPKQAALEVQSEMSRWQGAGIDGYFETSQPWIEYQSQLTPSMAKLVGAQASEVVVMNTLSVNLHFMMASFYRPTPSRYKILIEEHAFPSDHFAVESQIKQHGFGVKDSLLTLAPPPGEELISMEDIRSTIEKHGDEIALILLPGVQYYTGQVFDIEAITELGHQFGCRVGFDLAHAVGNIELSLHDWGLDFACWCTYKYLNSGPGSIGACFVHQRHCENPDLHRLAGWWGHNKETRFEMKPSFDPIPTAQGWQVSCPPILAMAPIKASLALFERVGGMPVLRKKSERLTAFLWHLIDVRLQGLAKVVSPKDAASRGCQLSVEVVECDGRAVFEALLNKGIVCDWRYPSVIRIAPVPLYNSFEDVYRFVGVLEELLQNPS